MFTLYSYFAHRVHSILYVLATLSILLLSSCQSQGTDETPNGVAIHEPQIHLHAPSMGTPGGLIFQEDQYHLFYPVLSDDDSTAYQIGIANSNNLTSWQMSPIQSSKQDTAAIISINSFIDWDNLLGLSPNDEPPLITFIAHDINSQPQQYQQVNYSKDQSVNWKEYGHFSIKNITDSDIPRHSKIIWDADSQQWVAVYTVDRYVRFYGSKDLKNWKLLSEFGHQINTPKSGWERPDFFPIFIHETGDKKWILFVSHKNGTPNGGSGTQYFVGEFDGKRFRLDQEFAAKRARNRKKDIFKKACWVDFGRDSYGTSTWIEMPEDDDRRIMMSWMNNTQYSAHLPTAKMYNTITLPRELSLHNTQHGPRLFQQFTKELRSLRQAAIAPDPNSLATINDGLRELAPQQLELIVEATIDTEAKGALTVQLTNASGNVYTIGFDAEKDAYFSDRTNTNNQEIAPLFADSIHYAPKQLEGSLIAMHFVFDASSVELIADDGLTVLTDLFFPNEIFTDIRLYSSNANTDIQELIAYQLSSTN